MSGKPLPANLPRLTGRWLALALTVFTGFLLTTAQTAAAHTGFESSAPSDEATVDEPVDVITITFTGPAEPVGDGFVALNAAGELQVPTDVVVADEQIFTITFDPPLSGGEIGVRWNVKAADAHPIEGAFSFVVTAPPATSTTPTSTITTATSPTTSPATAPIATAAPVTEPAATTAAPSATAAPTTAPVVVAEGADDEDPTLEEFLTIDESKPGATTSLVGRVIGFLGVILGLGWLAFAATALRGTGDEVRSTLTAIRVFGGVIAVGSIVEYVGVARTLDESIGSAWSVAPGFATIVRAIGGIGLAIGVGGSLINARNQRLVRRPSVARSLSAAVLDDPDVRRTGGTDRSLLVRWVPDATSWPAVSGVVLIIVSFWFDGHTVSKGFRPLHALVNSVHVAAGAVWVGGVIAMATIFWSRYRSGRPMRAVELVVRFSKIASIAFVTVIAAGGLMAVLVLDSFGELTSTPWGKILLLKSAAVGLASLGGAYNHFRLLPALEADPDGPELLAELRSIVTAEAILLTFVVTVTAWLVAAAS